MIPYGRQNISEEDIEAVIEVLRSDWITQGPVVPLFEEAIARYCGARSAVATSNATSALHIACLALGVGSGDVVWTSANTFAASANCAVYCGASVDFIDIDPKTYNLSIVALSEKLEQAKHLGRLPKVVIPVHFAGQSCQMDKIFELSKEFGFKILEDASHAIGGRYQDRAIGSSVYSDITVFSFHPVKIITSGEGGMATTNDPHLEDAMRLYRNHGITNDSDQMIEQPANEIWRYQQIHLGFNYRITDIQAALGLSQLNKLNEFVSARHDIAGRYDQELTLDELSVPWQHPDTISSFHLYPVRLRSDVAKISQATLVSRLVSSEIHVNHHYIPVYRHPFYESLGFKRGYCPEAETYFRETISLPIFPSLSYIDQTHVIDSLKRAVLNP